MKLVIPFLIVTSFYFSSCKKKDEAPPAQNATTGNPAPASSSGVFLSDITSGVQGTVITSTFYSSRAYVSSQNLVDNNPIVGSLVDIGNVSLNGVFFKKNWLSANTYADSTNTNFSLPHQWSVSGSNFLAAFSFTNSNPYPVYTGYTAAPDSVISSQGVSIPLNNYSGADEVTAYFVMPGSPSKVSKILHLYNQPASVNFSAADLAALGTGPNAQLNLGFYKDNIQSINGKMLNFRTGYSVIKANIKLK